jgi:hypothetical protein
VDLEDLLTPAAVDAFIESDINEPELLATAKSGCYTQCHCMENPKLDAICKALAHRRRLTDEIEAGTRLPTGELVTPES